MAKIRCKCGNILHENTDGIRYKGYIISDQELFNMLDLADEMIESEILDREEAVMTFRGNIGDGRYIRLKNILQCPVCARILIENTPGSFCSFLPEEENNKDLLDFKVNGDIKYYHRKNRSV